MSVRCGWKIAAASVLGTSHAKLGTPCQDAHMVKTLDKDGEEVLVIVVSDGAGSAVKAEVGSLLACSTVAEAAEAYLIDGGKVSDICPDTARSWIRLVQQAVVLCAEDEGATPRDYACTMLVAIIGEDAAAIMQIGDGATVVGDNDGWRWVHWPQHGEFANATNFVTEPEAGEKLEFDLIQGRIDEVSVFSDGIERLVLHEASKTVFAPFFDRMFPAVRAIDGNGLDSGSSEALKDYLDSKVINEKTNDDKTLILATRRTSLFSESQAAPLEVMAKDE